MNINIYCMHYIIREDSQEVLNLGPLLECETLLGEFSALTCLYGILINLLKTHSKIALRFVAHKNHVLYT